MFLKSMFLGGFWGGRGALFVSGWSLVKALVVLLFLGFG